MNKKTDNINLGKFLSVWGFLTAVFLLAGSLLLIYAQRGKNFVIMLNAINIPLFTVLLLIRRPVERGITEMLNKSAGAFFEIQYDHEKSIGFFLVSLAILFGSYMGFLAFSNVGSYSYMIKEDGIIEYGSSILWFLAAMVVFIHIFRRSRCGVNGRWQLMTDILLIIFFILCAGEEISWGQRIIGIETPGILREVNVQRELTLHNIESVSIFSNAFFLLTVIFFLVVPWFAKKYSQVRKLLYFIHFPVSTRFIVYIFIVTLFAWILVGLRFGTLGFHPFSFYPAAYYTQMDDELFEFLAAFSFFSFSIMHAVKHVKAMNQEIS
ncbi:MAG: hypothetical protein JW814_02610 [Candidatus Krumholzibacteriota bacterium]|nr:hypothetical protein [Candidatus Krumholzibacteriota bacterium]